MQLTPGAELAGRYKLDRLIGRGGMGEVWAASQTLTRKHVALKVLVGESASNPDTRKRLVREARAACAVEHPNVVQVHDVVELEDGVPAIVMELLRGESLEERLKTAGKLSLGEAASVLLRVVSAVGTAHALGIVHRDIKPDNIFLASTPEGVEVKVLDFGVAKIGATEDGGATGALTATGTMLGTPYYMSPEQAFGEKKIDHRSDIWSLGIVLFRCLSGVLPTRAENLGQILKIIMTRAIPKLADVAPGLPPDVASLVDRMLSYAPADRPSDLREVKSLLEKYAGVHVEDFAPPTGAVVDDHARRRASPPEPSPLESPPSLEMHTQSAVSGAAPSVRTPRSKGVYGLAGAVVLAAVVVVTVLLVSKPRGEVAPVASSSSSSTTTAAEPASATTPGAAPPPRDAPAAPSTAPQPSASGADGEPSSPAPYASNAGLRPGAPAKPAGPPSSTAPTTTGSAPTSKASSGTAFKGNPFE